MLPESPKLIQLATDRRSDCYGAGYHFWNPGPVKLLWPAVQQTQLGVFHCNFVFLVVEVSNLKKICI